MVPVASLWLPILVSAVIVFLASWIVHMFLPYHRSDFAKLPQEDAVLDALRSLSIPSGQYLAPFANTPAQMKQPEYLEKRKRGPRHGEAPAAVVCLLARDFGVRRVSRT